MSKQLEGKGVILPPEIYNKIEDRVKETDFNSVDEYVIFILEEILREEDQEEGTLSKEEEENVKTRLKALGYLE